MYFHLHPDVYLECGAVGGALYDVGNGRLRPLSEEETGVVARLQKWISLEDIQSTFGPQGLVLVDELRRERFGRYYTSIHCVEPYVRASNSRTPGFFEPPLVIRAAYVQVTSSCNEDCRDCGSLRRPVWQGCNGCERWPGTRPGMRWSPNELVGLVQELGILDVRNVFFSGGNPLLECELLMAAIRALREAAPTVSIIVTTNGAGLSEQALETLRECGAKLNLVWTAGHAAESDARAVRQSVPPKLARLTAACRASGIPFYVTIDIRESVQDPDQARKSADQLGGQRVLISEPLTLHAGSRFLPLRSVSTLGANRLKTIGPEEVDLRKRHNCCLHGVVAIAVDGTVRPCPNVPAVLGHVESGGLRTILRERRHEAYWHMTKDHIHGCRSCEFRYACVDCAAVDLWRGMQSGIESAVCGYDPFSGTWRTGGRTKLECV